MLPIIDFTAFPHGSAAARQDIADEIGRTLETIGFFYVKGHGIPEAIQSAARAAVEAYFRLPEPCKQRQHRQPGRYRGYIPPIPFTSSNAVANRPPILYEAFIVGPEVRADDPAVAASKGLLSPTPWPD